MSIGENGGRKPRFRLPKPGEITLLAVIAATFLLLHVVAGALMLPGSSGLASPQEQASLPSTD